MINRFSDIIKCKKKVVKFYTKYHIENEIV